MCGFVGVIFKNPDQAVDRSRLTAARDTLAHRGPDEHGLWANQGVGLAHRRLSVLDLKHGQQPMSDNRYSLVYNGEIYNFQELQETCKAKKLTIETSCDTEVLFKLLNADGLESLSHFNGMFAFAHWDTQTRTLLMARDRLGQKPLYWFKDEQCCVFASELKAILRFLERRLVLDPIAIDQYFARGYILSPRTIFKDIHKLPAGCSLTLNADSWEHAIASYWDYSPVEVPSDPGKAIDQLDELLSDAVRKRLISDVPFGCLLSGGIDSTLMTAMAAKTMGKGQLKTFSIGFDSDDPRFNELPYAKMTAEHHHCQWNSKVVELGDFLELVDDVSDYFDEPFANFAMFPMRRLAQLCREQLTVVLSGQGGDELSAGYEGRYNWAVATTDQKIKPSPMDHLSSYLSRSNLLPWAGAREAMYSSQMSQTLLKQVTGSTHVGEFWMRHQQFDTLNQALYADVKTNLPDYLVCVEERMTMAASLEARNPMLDYRVVNYMLSMPTSMKVRGNQFKWVLFELAKRYGPIEAIDRPKRGFTPPLGQWIVQAASQLGQMFNASQASTAQLFNPQWQAFLQAGQFTQQHTMPVFYSLMFTKWCEKYADYIAPDLPLDSPGFESPVSARDHHWHRGTLLADPMTLSESRLSNHLFNHFESDDHILLVGDENGWFSRVFQASGKTITRSLAPEDWPESQVVTLTKTPEIQTIVAAQNSDLQVAGTIMIGMSKLASQLAAKQYAGKRLVCLIPFAINQQQQVQALLQQIATLGTIAGHQVVNLSEQQAALVVRCELQ
ncbi:MAG TPA: asparagine synthase (glutamine-hydrolyzing) [Phycisphaerales bacterium]|nr:asparagine synthase (glutamine-hydrolyzing) [Phycisphaerales bacterium]|tara:strand:- start:874 stop:3222 length:2349 start_codon:yes stop_codon:yes gene_type:complete